MHQKLKDLQFDSVRIPRRDFSGQITEDGAEYVVYQSQQVGVSCHAASYIFARVKGVARDMLQVLGLVVMTVQQYEMYAR